MSERAERFVQHLAALQGENPGAMAALRRSQAFAPGTHAPAFPFVERFVGSECPAWDAWRLALYVVAGLFARHPLQESCSFAAAFGDLMRERESKSIEKRFIALLEADAENVAYYLRQAVSLLASEQVGIDYVQLLDDLAVWMNPHADTDRIRQRWARDFYRKSNDGENQISNPGS